MPIHDYTISNGTGQQVREDINFALQAIVSLNSSASEPGTMYAYQLWADTALQLLKIRNSGNSAWITLRQLDGDFSIVAVEDGLQATPSLTFTNDLNTGVFRSGNDALAVVTGGQYAITCTSTQAVGIKTANPSTALHVAGNARVGADDVTDAVLEIGVGATGNRNAFIDIVGDTTYTDYGVRLIRNNTGANATSEIKHRGTGAFNIVAQEAAPIEFYTSNSPRVAITSAGLVGIGSSSPGDYSTYGNKLVVFGTGTNGPGITIATGTGDTGSLFFADGTSGGAATRGAVAYAHSDDALDFHTSGSAQVRIDSSGRLLVGTIASPAHQLQVSTDSAGKPSTNTWTIVSDERIKEEIELADLDLCYAAVKTIPLKRFKWKDEVYTEEQVRDRRKLGWIAQDVEAVFPKAVGTYEFKYNQVFEETIVPAVKEELDDEGNATTPAQPERIEKGKLISEDVIEDCRDLNSDQLYAAMYGAIQKLMIKVEALETEITSLKAIG